MPTRRPWKRISFEKFVVEFQLSDGLTAVVGVTSSMMNSMPARHSPGPRRAGPMSGSELRRSKKVNVNTAAIVKFQRRSGNGSPHQ